MQRSAWLDYSPCRIHLGFYSWGRKASVDLLTFLPILGTVESRPQLEPGREKSRGLVIDTSSHGNRSRRLSRMVERGVPVYTTFLMRRDKD